MWIVFTPGKKKFGHGNAVIHLVYKAIELFLCTHSTLQTNDLMCSYNVFKKSDPIYRTERF